MKLISYQSNGVLMPGLVRDGQVFNLQSILSAADIEASAEVSSVRAFLETYGANLKEVGNAFECALESASVEALGSVESFRLGPPIDDPAKVLCVGLNYSDHVGETGRAMPEYPDLFAKFASSLIGPNDDIDCSALTENLDFEGELAIILGRPCSRVGEHEALDYVAGLSVLNDITARDLQYRGTQWLAGKAVDGSTPFGPALVTLDEIGDPQNLQIQTLVNGDQVQHSNTKFMIFSIEKIVSYVSQFLTLNPGDVIATGTPEGIGAKRNPPMWLEPGDKVEVVLERVGVLSNEVV